MTIMKDRKTLEWIMTIMKDHITCILKWIMTIMKDRITNLVNYDDYDES